MKLVIVESPFRGLAEELALAYVRACLLDCLRRGEAPFASHALYTQPGVLDDNKQEERNAGINAGLAWGEKADLTVVYTDYGISEGMRIGIVHAEQHGREVVYRALYS